MKKTSLVVLGLISTLTSVAAMADWEDSKVRAAERLARDLQQSQTAQYSTVVPPSGTMMIFQGESYMRHQAVGARIERVLRSGNTMLVINEFNQAYVIPYFTAQGAEEALQMIGRGHSIDVSNCMTADIQISNTKNSDGSRTLTYKTKMDCTKMTRVSLYAPGSEPKNVWIQNIQEKPLIKETLIPAKMFY